MEEDVSHGCLQDGNFFADAPRLDDRTMLALGQKTLETALPHVWLSSTPLSFTLLELGFVTLMSARGQTASVQALQMELRA